MQSGGGKFWIISLEPYSETFTLVGEIYPFGWSPDGKYVYAIRGSNEIIRVQASAPNEIISMKAFPINVLDYDSASVSPDGRQIIISLAAEESDVWVMENFDSSAHTARQ